MNKRILIAITAILLAGMIAPSLNAVPPLPRLSPCGDYGDLDNNGYITSTDADCVQWYLVTDDVPDASPLSETEFIHRADVNDDGEVTIVDAMMIAQYAGEVIDTFPVCEEEEEEELAWLAIAIVALCIIASVLLVVAAYYSIKKRR